MTGLVPCIGLMGAVAPFVLTVRAGKAMSDGNSCCLCWASGSGLLIPLLTGVSWGCMGSLCLASLYTQTRATMGIRVISFLIQTYSDEVLFAKTPRNA